MNELIIGAAINIAIAVVVGLIPLLIAKRKAAMKYGVSSLVLCMIAGILVGFVGSIPIAVVLGAIAWFSSPNTLKSLGENEAGGIKDAAIAGVFILMAIGILVIWAIQVDALG